MKKGNESAGSSELSKFSEPVKEAEAFVNPFEPGVTYQQFAQALRGRTVKEYLDGWEKSPGKLFAEEDINWLEGELTKLKN